MRVLTAPPSPVLHAEKAAQTLAGSGVGRPGRTWGLARQARGAICTNPRRAPRSLAGLGRVLGPACSRALRPSCPLSVLSPFPGMLGLSQPETSPCAANASPAPVQAPIPGRSEGAGPRPASASPAHCSTSEAHSPSSRAALAQHAQLFPGRSQVRRVSEDEQGQREPAGGGPAWPQPAARRPGSAGPAGKA